MEAASTQYILEELSRGTSLPTIARASSWRPRQIQALASRHGYLFTVAGEPYKPPPGKSKAKP